MVITIMIYSETIFKIYFKKVAPFSLGHGVVQNCSNQVWNEQQRYVATVGYWPF